MSKTINNTKKATKAAKAIKAISVVDAQARLKQEAKKAVKKVKASVPNPMFVTAAPQFNMFEPSTSVREEFSEVGTGSIFIITKKGDTKGSVLIKTGDKTAFDLLTAKKERVKAGKKVLPASFVGTLSQLSLTEAGQKKADKKAQAGQKKELKKELKAERKATKTISKGFKAAKKAAKNPMGNPSKILKKLDKSQRKALRATRGPKHLPMVGSMNGAASAHPAV